MYDEKKKVDFDRVILGVSFAWTEKTCSIEHFLRLCSGKRKWFHR